MAPASSEERDTGRVPGRFFVRLYLGLVGVLAAAYFAFPGHHLLLWTPLGLSAVAATVVGIARNRPARPAAWYLLAGGEFCFVAGDTAYNVLTDVFGQRNPFPSVADVFYLLMYPLLAMGLFLLIRGRTATRDRASLIDALIVTTGLGLLSWVYLVLPYFRADGLTVLQRAISIGYPLGDVLVLSMLTRLVGGRGLGIASTRLLVLGTAGLLVTDVLYGLIQLNGTWKMGGPVDTGWIVFYAAWGAAALHPSMRQVDQSVTHGRGVVRRGRLGLLAAVSLIAPAVMISQAGRHTHSSATVAVFSAALSLLVVARLAGVAGVHRQAVARERVLRATGESLVAARDAQDVYLAAFAAVTSLTGPAAAAHATIYLADAGGVRRMASTPADVGEDEPGGWDTARDGGMLSPEGTRSVNPLRFDHELRGVLVVRSRTALTIDVHGALATLASQVALALGSARLAADLRQRQNEAHFRGLIQNASDIILVVGGDGTVTYGTPSLERVLGWPVPEVSGRPLVELLHPEDVSRASLLLADLAVTEADRRSIVDWRLRHVDGEYRSFEVSSSNLLADPDVGGIVLTMRDVSERRSFQDRLQHQAFHDGLTGLANRALFQDRAEHAVGRVARLGTTAAMIMLDLDDFKIVNDTRGHGAGDELLVAAAERLVASSRTSDTLARFGGDEFAILMEDVSDAAGAEEAATRFLASLAEPFVIDGEQLRIRASAGLVVVGGGAEGVMSLPELLRRADLALYAAKDRGKGNFVQYYDALRERMVDRITRKTELQHAVETDEFVVLYQPIVAIGTGQIVGAEALVRWNHPRLGMVAPAEFIELAEQTGLIVDIGRSVLNQACAQARVWRQTPGAAPRLSVNVSVRQLQEAGFVDEVSDTLARHQLPPAALVLELTESLLADDGTGIPQQLTDLKALGLDIAIDDFGTGYSSLGYLRHFPIDILKVDKSFVDGLGTGNQDDGALAHAVISLAKSLRLQVVAEGIERVEQRDELLSIGCELGQGYLYARPLDATEFSRLLAGRPIGPTPALTTRASIVRSPTPAPTYLLSLGPR